MTRVCLFWLVLFCALGAQAVPDILVLPGVRGERGRQASQNLSVEIAEELAERGFMVMTDFDVRSLFRATGCYDIDGDKARSIPFALSKTLAKEKVGVVVNAHLSNDILRLTAIDTARAQVVLRKKIAFKKSSNERLRRTLREIRPLIKHIDGRRVFTGLTGESAPKVERMVRSILRTQKGLLMRKCTNASARRFEVVVRAHRDVRNQIVISGDENMLLAHKNDDTLAEKINERALIPR